MILLAEIFSYIVLTFTIVSLGACACHEYYYKGKK